MVAFLIKLIFSIWIVNVFCRVFLDINPLKYFKSLVGNKPKISLEEKERLLQLEEARLDKEIASDTDMKMRAFEKEINDKTKK